MDHKAFAQILTKKLLRVQEELSKNETLESKLARCEESIKTSTRSEGGNPADMESDQSILDDHCR